MTRSGGTAGHHPLERLAEAVGRLALGPAGVFAAAVLMAGELRLPGLLTPAMVGCAAVGAGGWAVHRHAAFPARLERAMTDAGLTYRDADGRVQRPRRAGRAIHRGATITTRWALPPTVSLQAVLDRKAAVEEQTDSDLWCWFERGRLVVEAQSGRIPERVEFDAFHANVQLPGPFALGLGLGRGGPIVADLRGHAHLLIGGITGGGKSVLLRQALTATLLAHGPDQLRIVAIDLKGGVELGILDGLPHLLGPGGVITTVEEAASVLGAVREELDARLSALRAHGAADLDDAVALGMPARPRVLVVVDELAELTARDTGESRAARDAQRAAVGRLCEIARLGRAVGIHLLVCTQRPDADVVPGQLKANLGGTVAFRVRSRVNSEILLEDDRAARLPHRPGRALWVHERVEEFQAVHIGRQDARLRLCDRWLAATTAGRGPVPVTLAPQPPRSSSTCGRHPRGSQVQSPPSSEGAR